MCDSCPDMCFFEGELYPSCRLDELRKWGELANAAHTRRPDKDKDKDKDKSDGARERKDLPIVA